MSTTRPSSTNKSQSTSMTLPTTFEPSTTRVFVDVSVPRHQGPRLSLADIDPDASKASKRTSMASLGVKSKDDTARRTRPALKPTTRTNSFTGVKRGREDEKDAKEGVKKRKVENAPVPQKNNAKDKMGQKQKGGVGASKNKGTLDTTTVAPKTGTVADSEVAVKKAVVKKPQPEPQPLWTRVGADFTREEIEERILLREFVLRFNECLGLKRPVLEKLEDFGEFDDVTAKALLLAMMELLRQNAPSDERRVLADFIKQVRARGMSFYDILYTMHHKLRTGTSLHIPNLSDLLSNAKKDQDSVESTALIPVMLSLIDDVLETDVARKEVDRWKEEAAEVRRTYHRGMKEEKERWGPARVKLMDEKKVGGAGFDAAKWKKKFEAAKAKHDTTEHALRFTLIKQLAEISPRCTPLVDMDGRTYYFPTPSLRKPPAKSTRDDFGKWTWFVAVWGTRPASAKRVDDDGSDEEEEDAGDDSKSTTSSLTDPEESEDEISGAKEEREARAKANSKRASSATVTASVGSEGWWGFGEAAELKLLAKWIQWCEQEANGSAEGGSADGGEEGGPDAEGGDAGDGAGLKRLVGALNDFASVLQYADDVISK